jgi:hypothetical protein
VKKPLAITLGIINLVFAGMAAAYFGLWVIEHASGAFTIGLPVLIAAVFTLIAGIFSLKKRSLRWALAGLGIIGAIILFFVIII